MFNAHSTRHGLYLMCAIVFSMQSQGCYITLWPAKVRGKITMAFCIKLSSYIIILKKSAKRLPYGW